MANSAKQLAEQEKYRIRTTAELRQKEFERDNALFTSVQNLNDLNDKIAELTSAQQKEHELFLCYSGSYKHNKTGRPDAIYKITV